MLQIIIIGLKIIEKYDGDVGDFDAEHDQVWAGQEDGKSVTEMTDGDKKTMGDAGWFVDGEFNCWSLIC